MSDKRTTARAFHNAEGVDDWRVLYWGAYAYYRIGAFVEGRDSLPRSPRSRMPWVTSPTSTFVPKG